MADADVKVPAVGRVNKNVAIYGGAALVFIAVAYYVHRKRVAGSTSTTATSNVPSADPNNPASVDAFQGAQLPLGYYDAYGNLLTTGAGDSTTQLPPATNAELTTRAEAYLSQLGFDSQTVATALGTWMSRTGVTQSQADIVNAARAALGPPPQGDFPVQVVATTPVTSSGGSSGSSGTGSGGISSGGTTGTTGTGSGTTQTNYTPGYYTVGPGVSTWGDIATIRIKFFGGTEGIAQSYNDLVALNPQFHITSLTQKVPAAGTKIRIF